MIRKTLVAAAVLAASAPAASAGTGTAEFFAAIRSAGTIIQGSGVSSSAKVGVGRYEVFFPRPVNTCVYVATPISSAASKAVVRVTSTDASRILVNTFNATSTLTDVGFNLLVKCQD